MGVHEAADGVLTRMEADRLRTRALELVALYDGVALLDLDGLLAWAAKANVVLRELARG